MDGLEFPSATRRFPALDVLVLVLISLIPYVLKKANAIYTSGPLSAPMFAWSLVMREITSENAAALEPLGLRGEMRTRAIAGSAFAATAFVVFLQMALSGPSPSRRAR